jgi:hypothetical protein
MTAMKGKAMAALAICALALTALGSVKNPVTRPVKGIGHITTVVDLATREAIFTQWGQGTHLGSWTDTGEGIMAPDFQSFVSGHGTAVAANGDTFDWELTGPNSNRYTSGTGRFQGVTGGMTFTITSAAAPIFNEDGTMMILEFTYEMVGEVTY